MKKLFAAFAVAALVVPAVRADDKTSDKTIVEIAAANPDFSTLVTAVKAAGLADTLSGGTFTVFAPTNAAFEKLGKSTIEAVLADKKKLTAILMAHVVKDKAVMAADVVGMKGKKVNGYTVEVDGDNVFLTNGDKKVKVVKTDIKAKNGVIHVIDTVILPVEKKGYGK
jgi:uncharacterized surface protein with fasciclin (FAS1) repeats